MKFLKIKRSPCYLRDDLPIALDGLLKERGEGRIERRRWRRLSTALVRRQGMLVDDEVIASALRSRRGT